MIRPAHLVVVAASLTGAAPSDRPARQPTNRWLVEFANAQCVAQRNYGTTDKPLYLVFKQPPLGSVMQIAVADKRSTGFPAQLKGQLTFGSNKPIPIQLLRYEPEGAKLRTFLINLPLDQFAGVRSASSMRIRTDAFDERFALSGLPALLKTMDECVVDLRTVWNVTDTQAEREPLVGGTKGNLRGIFRGDDYPREALIRGQGGTAKVALLIDERGRIADCSIMETSQVPALDAQTCFILKTRARFTPASGPDGKPAKSGYTQRITWQVR